SGDWGEKVAAPVGGSSQEETPLDAGSRETTRRGQAPQTREGRQALEEDQAQGLRLLQGEDRLRRLQGRGLAAEVRLRARQDPRPPGDGQLRAASAGRRHRRQERPSDGAPTVFGAMKVILQKPVEKLGDPRDIVEVAAGYARNYLVPHGLAVRAEKGALKHAENLKRAHVSRQSKEKVEFEAVAATLIASKVLIAARAGEEGKLCGSVTAADIAVAIAAQTDIRVDRKDVHLEEPIRSLGTHEVRVHLFPDAEPVLTLEVTAEE